MANNGNKITVAVSAGVLACLSFFAHDPQIEGRTYVAIIPVPGDVPTICDGFTKGVKMGDTATPAECDQHTIDELKVAESIFNAAVDPKVAATLHPLTRAAYYSLIYNVGPGEKGRKDGFVRLKNGNPSTMLRLLNAGDVRASCNQFVNWAKFQGRVLKGLMTRRKKEQAMCLAGLQ